MTPFAVIVALAAVPGAASERQLLDSGWRFKRGDDAAWSRRDLDDGAWQHVDLPHDWSIAGDRTADAPGEGHFGFFPAGIGWYRRTLEAPDRWQGQRVALHFEAAYRHAEVWCNGQRVGGNLGNGYVPFRCDLTSHLKFGQQNTIAVRVRNDDVPNARWYTGSGLYRHVWLEVRPQVHLAPDGLAIVTRLDEDGTAHVDLQADVANATDATTEVKLLCQFDAADGRRIQWLGDAQSLPPGEDVLHETLTIERPQLWSHESPHLHDLTVELVVDDRPTDSRTVRLGLRTVEVSSEQGLLLNGKPVALNGGCVHSDLGPLGAAAFDDAEWRRVRLLKAAGFNCLRTAHNPPSTAFLDACDELGMLVIDEAFDSWEVNKVAHDSDGFRENCEAVIDALVRRDRNHPSVIMWSIGNEMYERSKPRAVELSELLSARVRKHDETRPITAAVNGLGESDDWEDLDPLFATLDVAGYNYELPRIAADHDRVPGRIIYASETFPKDVFEDWQATQQNPFVLGACVWTAQDYLGEAGIGRTFPPGETARAHWEGSHFPWHGGACGDLDLIGDRRPHSHYRQIAWDAGETLFGAVKTPPPGDDWQLTLWSTPVQEAHWTWPNQDGKPLTVVAYSRHEAVRVKLNDRTMGEAPTTAAEEFRAEFTIPYEPGTLRFAALENGEEVRWIDLVTVGEAAQVAITAESKEFIADRQSLAFVGVTIEDDAGRRCPHADDTVAYRVTGPAEIIAVGSGDLATTESYVANPRKVFQGRALVVLRSTGEPGEVEIVAEAAGRRPGRATFTARSRPE